eukprot:CAMPEP_0178439394 /NCGR_PEP_ID=MMETSP0689_2-20121128/36132_1 /TAXON_ID=160604 /ORGANISM="Amphidinium massartii, Strain CS-259" /LENGTH=206 /DNA_ID=CAMNT_0020061919 /DNA_START=139 /DNA_END=759 /DNA_ORIENTATION=-
MAAAKKVFLFNGHAAWPFAKGELNKSMLKLAKEHFESLGCEIKETAIDSLGEDYDMDAEVEKFQWADFVFFQTPAYWFGVPWQFKKYIDEVYTAGLDGRMTKNDGRSSKSPQDNYGTGGTLNGRYMLSVTANAPKGAFRKGEYLYDGMSEDEAWVSFHLLNRFCNLQQVPDSTFTCYDVMKNPDVENDFKKFKAHMQKLFPNADAI